VLWGHRVVPLVVGLLLLGFGIAGELGVGLNGRVGLDSVSGDNGELLMFIFFYFLFFERRTELQIFILEKARSRRVANV
jgi:hypothetical protein